MNILITRPLIDAEDLMEKLFAYDHKIIHLPTLRISTVETKLINPDNFDAFIFTSTNAVRNLKLINKNKKIYCFCVGSITEKIVRQSGFVNTTSAGGTVGFHIQGNDNSLTLTQGCVYDNTSSATRTSGSYEAANHVMIADVHGDDNVLKLGQRAGNSDKHDMTVYVYGDNNSVFAKQKGTGEKYLYLQLNGDGHSLSSVQTGQGSHNASITLTRGSGSYALNLTQHSDTTQNYSLTGTCQNASGCGVTVTQN